MVGRTKYRTKADADRMAMIAAIGCLPCMLSRHNDVPCQVHHVTECGERMEDEHRWTFGGCPWHHEGQVPGSLNGSVKAATELLGPSLHHDKRLFKETYGTEEELVLIQDGLINAQRREMSMGRYLPPEQLGRLAILLHRRVRLEDQEVTG